jgi:hypothetical protein
MVQVQTRKIRIQVEASKGVLKLVTQLEIRTQSGIARVICAHSGIRPNCQLKLNLKSTPGAGFM